MAKETLLIVHRWTVGEPVEAEPVTVTVLEGGVGRAQVVMVLDDGTQLNWDAKELRKAVDA